MLFSDIMKKNKDFISLFKKGQVVVGRTCVVYFRPNHSAYNKIGVASSKKIGNAVKRNRARRVIRTAYRLCEKDFPIGFDIVCVARQAATFVKSDVVVKQFKSKVIPIMNSRDKK